MGASRAGETKAWEGINSRYIQAWAWLVKVTYLLAFVEKKLLLAGARTKGLGYMGTSGVGVEVEVEVEARERDAWFAGSKGGETTRGGPPLLASNRAKFYDATGMGWWMYTTCMCFVCREVASIGWNCLRAIGGV